jgi:thiol-disulfide isomerase/thioredoxin
MSSRISRLTERPALLAVAALGAILTSAGCGGGGGPEAEEILERVRETCAGLEAFSARERLLIERPGQESRVMTESEWNARPPAIADIRTFSKGEETMRAVWVEGAHWRIDHLKKRALRLPPREDGPCVRWLRGMDRAEALHVTGRSGSGAGEVIVLEGRIEDRSRTWHVSASNWTVVRREESTSGDPGALVMEVFDWNLHAPGHDYSVRVPEGYEFQDALAAAGDRDEDRARREEEQRRALLGRPAPPFDLPDLEGKRLALEDFRGRVVLLNFWGTWCAACVVELPRLQEIQDRLGPQGFQLLALDNEEEAEPDLEAVAGMADRLGLKAPVLLTDEAVLEAYRVFSYPTNVLIDRQGVVRKVHTGYERGDEKRLEGEIRELLAGRSPATSPR